MRGFPADSYRGSYSYMVSPGHLCAEKSFAISVQCITRENGMYNGFRHDFSTSTRTGSSSSAHNLPIHESQLPRWPGFETVPGVCGSRRGRGPC